MIKKFSISECMAWMMANPFKVLPGIMALILVTIRIIHHRFEDIVQNSYREFELHRSATFLIHWLVDAALCFCAATFIVLVRRKQRKRTHNMAEIQRQQRYEGLFGMETDFVDYLRDQGVHLREPQRLDDGLI